MELVEGELHRWFTALGPDIWNPRECLAQAREQGVELEEAFGEKAEVTGNELRFSGFSATCCQTEE